MAPTFKHGRGANICIGRYNMTPYVNNATINRSLDAAETTHWGQNDKNYIPGLRDGTVKLDGLFSFSSQGTLLLSTEFDSVMQRAVGGSTTPVVTVGFEGASTGGYAVLMRGDQTAYEVAVPVADVVSFSMDLNSSRVEGGVWLRPIGAAAQITTGSNGTVSYAGSTATPSSTGGGVGHLHITSATTLTAGMVVKIQHSTSGSTWVDLITFTNATAETFQRSTVSGSIKEKLRATNFSMTGGAAKTVTYGVAFARRGKTRG